MGGHMADIKISLSEKSAKNITFASRVMRKPPQIVMNSSVALVVFLATYWHKKQKLIAFKGGDEVCFVPESFSDYDAYYGGSQGTLIAPPDLENAVNLLQQCFKFSDVIRYEVVLGVGLQALNEILTLSIQGYQFHIRTQQDAFVEAFECLPCFN